MRKFLIALCLILGAQGAVADSFKLWSPDITQGEFSTRQEMNGFGCHGANLSPALAWSGAPVATKSFAITLFDPDARAGAGWWHWAVVNIPAHAQELPAGFLAAAGMLQLRNDFGTQGYGGPCPPLGSRHRYLITLIALNSAQLDLDAATPISRALTTIQSHSLGSATLRAWFGR